MSELRFAVRQLVKRPAFTVMVMATLALGVGACVSIFSVANAMFLRLLPYQDTARLFWIWQHNETSAGSYEPVSAPNFLDWQQQSRTFAQMAVFHSSWPDLERPGTNSAPPVRLPCGEVSTNLFSLLGVDPMVGRGLLPEDERTPAAVLSYGLWQTRFGGETGLVGQTIRLSGEQYTVVGIMPPGFVFPPEPEPDQLWIPLLPARSARAGVEADRALCRFHVVGRLQPGASEKEAQAELDTIMARLASEHPLTNHRQGAVLHRLRNWWHHPFERIIYVLCAAVGLLLLMACGNVANLLLARATVRQQEIAVRAAVGASRGRILRQLLLESTLLSLGGASLGVLLAGWGTKLLAATIPLHNYRVGEIEVDGVALIFAFALALATGLVFGLAPAWTASNVDLAGALKDGPRGGEGRGPRRLREWLVVGQVALAVILLSGALTTGQQFFAWRRMSCGFRTDRMFTTELPLPLVRYRRPEQFVHFQTELLASLRGRPGVEAVATSTDPPLARGDGEWREFRVEGAPAPAGSAREPNASLEWVSRGYFDALGIPLLRGDDFTEQQFITGTNVAVISRELARKYFPDANPIGRRVRLVAPRPSGRERVEAESIEVIGVAADVKHGHPGDLPQARLYLPYPQKPSWQLFLTLRSSLNSAETERLIRRTVAALDPQLPIPDVHPMGQQLHDSLADDRVQVVLWTLFASLAVALAGIGIYGLLSFSVSCRSRDLALQLALGAPRGLVLRQVILGGLRLAWLGLGVGLLVSWMAWRAVSSQLYVSAPLDLTVGVLVVASLGLVTLVAAVLPARRASGIDPAVVLRCE
jgi:putative ABC transport system permease protein